MRDAKGISSKYEVRCKGHDCTIKRRNESKPTIYKKNQRKLPTYIFYLRKKSQKFML